jgi:hypothetical protein
MLDVTAHADIEHSLLEKFLSAKKKLDDEEADPEKKDNRKPPSGSWEELLFQERSMLVGPPCVPTAYTAGWVSDVVLTDPARPALQPYVVFTKAELELLRDRVAELVEIGDRVTRGAEDKTGSDFFGLVSRSSRTTMVNPRALDFGDAFSAPLGIDQLPYVSDAMRLTRADARKAGKVRALVQGLRLKLLHYEDLLRSHGSDDVWKLLSKNAKERVVAVRLDRLP